jgi:3-methyladenine DNA glycosylase/8-oxoguanine DNA glycosylase
VSAGESTARTRIWDPGYRPAIRATLSALGRGRGDPCLRISPEEGAWWATRTPEGPGLLQLSADPGAGAVSAQAWGAGADWLLDGVPELLGARDDPDGFTPADEHPRLAAAWRARPGWRVMRTRSVFEALAAAALEQRVTGGEAHAAWRGLVRRFGEMAPGPAGVPGTPASGMFVPPAPAHWAAIPSWEWLRVGVEDARRRVVLGAARVAGGLQRTAALRPEEGERIAAALRVVPGVGVWTAAEVRQRAHGDADAFSWNDFHAARNTSWALTGRVLDDTGCAEVIERYRGHRYRVQRLLELDGAARPRRAPRMTLPTHLPRVPS